MDHIIKRNASTNTGQRSISVRWSNGLVMGYQASSINELKDILRRESARLDSAELLSAVPVDVPLDLRPDPVTPPTQDELDKLAYVQARAKLSAMQVQYETDIKNGIIKVDDPERVALIAAQLDAVKALYKSDYGDVLTPSLPR